MARPRPSLLSRRTALAAFLYLAGHLVAVAGPVASAPFAADRALPAVQWTPLDIVFPAEPPAGTNRFDLAFEATLNGPGGARLTVPGFHDGDDRYVIRVAPPAAGEWTLTTSSRFGPLDGLRGRLAVSSPGAGQRGPIVVRTDKPHQFAYADGSPYFPIAFEVDWLFALDAEDADGIPKTRALLEHVAANGFNQIIFNVFAYDVDWPRDPALDPRYDYGKPRVFPYGGDNTRPQHDTLSVTFFQRFDRVIAELDRLGLVAHVMIYVWNKQVAWPAAESAADNRYFDYVVKRYQAFPNLIWDISKEATGYGRNDKTYITRRIERLRALDAHDRLVTVHDYGYCAAFPETVDFISIQDWTTEIWNKMMEVRAKHPRLPALNIEHGGYERGPYHVFDGSYLDPVANLDRAYRCVFAGAFPTHYWQDAAWNVVIHDPENLPASQRPHLHYYRHMAALVREAGITELAPAPGHSNVGFCLTNKRDIHVFYLPALHSSIYLREKQVPGPVTRAIWFDPLTGTSRDAGQPIGHPWPRYFPPNEVQPWILIVHTQPQS